ncbi:MAG: hypothetical protein OEZ16_10640, partial [Chromatiales bacterium]|nr:hypothetical protein [Chromatiales bacterium]
MRAGELDRREEGELTRATSSLRLRFLTPLVAAIVLLLILMAFTLFYMESQRQSYSVIHERLTQTQSITKIFYEKSVKTEIMAIHSIIAALRLDKDLNTLLARQDRVALLEHTSALFRELKQESGITHFYFHNADRVNLLRLHTPERYGDRIDRITAIWAEKRQEEVNGIELGVLGTFTLRVVAPWYDQTNGKLIGYLELGMEVDHVLDHIRELFGLDVAVMVYKEFLEHDSWQEGMSLLGRKSRWEQFDNVVLMTEYEDGLPAMLENFLQQGNYLSRDMVHRFEEGGAVHWLMSLPLQDAMGIDVAVMVLHAETPSEAWVMRDSLLIVGGVVFMVGCLLVGFFYW